MTTEQMRIAVAEWIGWKRVVTTENVMHFPGGMLPTQVTRWSKHILKLGKFARKGGPKELAACVHEEDELPDYSNDLNAMHEAEKKLPLKQREKYIYRLCDITRPDQAEPDSIDDLLTAIHATASQRLEALCRTLWPERFK